MVLYLQINRFESKFLQTGSVPPSRAPLRTMTAVLIFRHPPDNSTELSVSGIGVWAEISLSYDSSIRSPWLFVRIAEHSRLISSIGQIA
jgi:hypothetical protein